MCPRRAVLSAQGLGSQDGDPLEPRPPSSSGFERSLGLYEDTPDLALYRKWGKENPWRRLLSRRRLLEVSSTSPEPSSDAVRLFLQVRDLHAVRNGKRGTDRGGFEVKPWGSSRWSRAIPTASPYPRREVPLEHPSGAPVTRAISSGATGSRRLRSAEPRSVSRGLLDGAAQDGPPRAGLSAARRPVAAPDRRRHRDRLAGRDALPHQGGEAPEAGRLPGRLQSRCVYQRSVHGC